MSLNNVEIQPENGWLGLGKARIPTPGVSERGPFFRLMSQFSRYFGRSEVPDVLLILHIHPKLFWAWLHFASRLMPFGQLKARVREKIILRTAWNCRSRYEWGQHVDIGLGVGLADIDIIRVSRGPEAFDDAHDQAIMQACDDIFRDHVLSEQTWNTLKKTYSDKLMLEIILLIGQYVMLAGAINSAGLALDPPIERKLQDFYQRIAGANLGLPGAH